MLTNTEDRFSDKELFEMFNVDVPCGRITVDLWTVRKSRRKVDISKRKSNESDRSRVRKLRAEVYSMLVETGNIF